MVEDIDVIKDWGTGKIELEGPIFSVVIREVHIKQDGAIGDTPSIALVMLTPNNYKMVTQISINKLTAIFKELGYQLTRSESAGVKPPRFQVRANTGEIHQVKKYIINTDGSESVWCDTWYGHHRIGQDCEWVDAGVKGQERYELAFIPCADDDPRSVGSYTSHDGQSLCYVRELHIPAAAQSEKRYPWGPDEYPDLSSCTPEQKHETIFGLIQLAAKEIMRMFYAFGLKTHIECKVVNEPTNETFEFSFVKVGAAAQSGKEEAVAFGEYLRENGYRPVDMSDSPDWVQFGSKIGWLQGGKSVIKATAQVYDIYQKEKEENHGG